MNAGTPLIALGLALSAFGWEPPLPARPADAPAGRAFAASVANLELAAREEAVIREVLRGNVPDFWRKFVPVSAGPVTIHVAPDYLAVGSDVDFVRWPLSPGAATLLAGKLECMLPTTRMADLIHQMAPLKLVPQPRPPGPQMTMVSEFVANDDAIAEQRRAALASSPWGVLTAGHKKDVVLTPRLAQQPGQVAIYGWHRTDGTPIQPLYLGHGATWVDYSHGVRLVGRQASLNGTTSDVANLLADDRWWTLLSAEGPFRGTSYSDIRPVAPEYPGERTEVLFLPGGARALVSRPEGRTSDEPGRLVIYAVPAGNTIEQTLGRRIRGKDDDWHFDIQHIAAQARWLRNQGEGNLVVACVESPFGSWVAWRRRTPDAERLLAEIYAALRRAEPKARVALGAHSAGGSLIFGLIEQWERIPDEVERIALLDANYAYDPARGHARKLLEWLGGAKDRELCVSAYEDYRARLDGKPFASETGGTWGRSRAMLSDLEGVLEFSPRRHGNLETHVAANGRARFRLLHNPEGKIWHTRLVELNGFIDAMRGGGHEEGGKYRFLGPRAYEAHIAP